MKTDTLVHRALRDVSAKKISVRKAADLLKGLPAIDLDFAKIDAARRARCGFPEAVYCEGKTVAQITHIAKTMLAHDSLLLLTRLTETAYRSLKKRFPFLRYNKLGRVAYYAKKNPRAGTKSGILIITAGTADIPVAEEARVTLEIMGNNAGTLYDVGVAGIHRLFNTRGRLLKSNVIIVVAGMEGALASVVGGLVSKPVIAVPTSCGYGANFEGIAPLLTMLNSCAPGVAVVNIDNGFGAAYMANMINNMGTLRARGDTLRG